jgi:GDP-L-fucose synthase
MVGSALIRRLASEDCRILTAAHAEVDLTRQVETENWMRQMRPDLIFIAAARAGGILANSQYPADFIYDNTMIAMNVMRSAAETGVEKLLWLGSSCIYPKYAEQPIREDALLKGVLEPTNEAYAVAKIAGIKLAQAYARQYGLSYISAMPCNLYGPNDNFDLQSAHVLPALIRKMHEAKIAGNRRVAVWGTGYPTREFLHVDDLADACVFLMKTYDDPTIINVGNGGAEISIRDLAFLVRDIVGLNGEIEFDATKPDGTPRKVMDSTKLRNLGWRPCIRLAEGINDLYLRWSASISAAAAASSLLAPLILWLIPFVSMSEMGGVDPGLLQLSLNYDDVARRAG